MKIFIDVGAHHGQSSEIALAPKFGFDLVLAFEPSKASFRRLSLIHHPKLKLNNVGLGNKTRRTLLYGAGELGASIFESKRQLLPEEQLKHEEVQIVSASDQLKGLLVEENEIYLKLNCEGSEVEILQSLLSERLLHFIDSVYVDFDIKKVRNQEGVAQTYEKLLQEHNVRYFTPELLGIGGPEAVRKWLKKEVSGVRSRPSEVICYSLRLHLPLRLRAYNFAKWFLPKSLRRKIYPAVKKSVLRKLLTS